MIHHLGPTARKVERVGAYLLLAIITAVGFARQQDQANQIANLTVALCEAQNDTADRFQAFVGNIFQNTANQAVKDGIIAQAQKDFLKVDCKAP